MLGSVGRNTHSKSQHLRIIYVCCTPFVEISNTFTHTITQTVRSEHVRIAVNNIKLWVLFLGSSESHRVKHCVRWSGCGCKYGQTFQFEPISSFNQYHSHEKCHTETMASICAKPKSIMQTKKEKKQHTRKQKMLSACAILVNSLSFGWSTNIVNWYGKQQMAEGNWETDFPITLLPSNARVYKNW